MGILPYLFFSRQPSTCANLPNMAGQPNPPRMQHPPRNRWPFLKSGLINHWVFPTYSIRPATKSLFLGGEGGGGGPVCRLKSQTTRNSIRSRHYLEMPLMRGPRPQYPNYLKSPAVALDLALFGSSRENQWKDASLKRIGCPKKVQVDYFC